MRDVTPPPRMAIQAARVGFGVPGTKVGDAKGVLNPSTSTGHVLYLHVSASAMLKV